MAEITLKNPSGHDAGTVELDDETFGIRPNVPVMHQVVTAQLANRRTGTQSTKTRGEVRGGGAKPYRQKGTGNARQGSTNAPHYAGGGVALGPKPRSYRQRTPKKMIRLALRSALSDRAREGKVVVVDAWGFDSPSTRTAKAALAALSVDGRVLVVLGRDEETAALSFRNLPEVQLIRPGELNAYDVLCNDWIVFSRGTLPAATGEPRQPHADPSAGEPSGGVGTVHAEDPAEGAPEIAPDDTQSPAASTETAPDETQSSAPSTEDTAEPTDETRSVATEQNVELGEAQPSSDEPTDETRSVATEQNVELGEAQPSSEASAASAEDQRSSEDQRSAEDQRSSEDGDRS